MLYTAAGDEDIAGASGRWVVDDDDVLQVTHKMTNNSRTAAATTATMM